MFIFTCKQQYIIIFFNKIQYKLKYVLKNLFVYKYNTCSHTIRYNTNTNTFIQYKNI